MGDTTAKESSWITQQIGTETYLAGPSGTLGIALENRYTGDCIVGSNPTLSAIYRFRSALTGLNSPVLYSFALQIPTD